MKARLYASEFKRIIDNTKRFVGTSWTLNSKTQWIYLKVDAELKTIQATALDGHRVSIEYAEIVDADESFTCYIKPNIPKINKKDMYADLELNDKRLYVQVGESIVGYVQPEGEYYKVDELLNDMRDKEKIRTVGVDARFLKDALSSIGRFDNNIPLARIDLYGPKDPIIIRSGSKTSRQNIKIVLPVSLNDEQEES